VQSDAFGAFAQVAHMVPLGRWLVFMSFPAPSSELCVSFGVY